MFRLIIKLRCSDTLPVLRCHLVVPSHIVTVLSSISNINVSLSYVLSYHYCVVIYYRYLHIVLLCLILSVLYIGTLLVL